MKIALFFMIITTIAIAEVVDFGVQGKQYKIVEEDANELVKKGIKELNVTKIVDDVNKQVKEMMVGHQKIPRSFLDEIITKKDLVPARWDVLNFDGTALYKKGEMITSELPFGTRLDLCFVDGGLDDKIVKYVVDYYGKNCIYMINETSFVDFGKKYGVEAYPMGGNNVDYTQRFGIKVIPTKITKVADTITKETLNIKRIALELSK